MHPSAMANGKRFFDTYVSRLGGVTVMDLGSQDVNGSLRQAAPPGVKYIGVDFVEARGVDVVLTDPYQLPFDDESIDVVVCSSCFEHSEMFWLVFLEVLRILRPGGLLYLNVPANGAFHRYPVDCWRFYPDSGRGLVKWAKRSGMKPAMLESFTSRQQDSLWGIIHEDMWNDFVAVFVKDEDRADDHPKRILSSFRDFDNGFLLGSAVAMNYHPMPQDRRRLGSVAALASRCLRVPVITSVDILRRGAKSIKRRLGVSSKANADPDYQRAG